MNGRLVILHIMEPSGIDTHLKIILIQSSISFDIKIILYSMGAHPQSHKIIKHDVIKIHMNVAKVATIERNLNVQKWGFESEIQTFFIKDPI